MMAEEMQRQEGDEHDDIARALRRLVPLSPSWPAGACVGGESGGPGDDRDDDEEDEEEMVADEADDRHRRQQRVRRTATSSSSSSSSPPLSRPPSQRQWRREQQEQRHRHHRLSAKQRKELSRPSLIDLKLWAPQPCLVEPWDRTAADAYTLVHLKCGGRNTVPVPPHWRLKRRYLTSKRGLPAAPHGNHNGDGGDGSDGAAGGGATRTHRYAPHGQQYVELQEYDPLLDERRRRQGGMTTTMPWLGAPSGDGSRYAPHAADGFRPGHLSAALRDALGMRPGDNVPPWYGAMQRHGPPPAYPHLAAVMARAAAGERAQRGVRHHFGRLRSEADDDDNDDGGGAYGKPDARI